MSHSVTITRTTTSSTNTSYIVLNTGYLKTLPGILKLFELLIGAAVVACVAYYYSYQMFYGHAPDLFLLLMATSFMIGTFCLLLSCLTSLSTGGIISKTIYLIGAAIVGCIAYYYNRQSIWVSNQQDLFLYLMATTFMIGTFCLLLSCLTSLSTGGIISKTIYELIYHAVAAILLLVASLLLLIELSNSRIKGYKQYDTYMAAAILGLVNTILYFISAFLAHRSYRGI